MPCPVEPPAAGYASLAYGRALGATAVVHPLRHSRGHVLLRTIGGTKHRDASGSYPLFSCSRPERLPDDLAELPDDVVAFSVLPDPLLGLDPEWLSHVFDIWRPMGDHYMVDLTVPSHSFSRHHRRELRRAALHAIDIRIEPNALSFVDLWVQLYENLIQRKGITGVRRFSRDIFAAMLEVPGTVLLTAWDRDVPLGVDWYLEDGDRVYAHLSAYSSAGYERSVSYPMMEAAIQHFSKRARVLSLGGVPTLSATGRGIASFKKGWSTHARPAYFCGLALDPQVYAILSGGRAPSSEEFFPYFRRSDFT